MRVCSPELGLDPDANLGGAVYDRELLAAMASEGADVDILMPEGERVLPHPRWHVSWTRRHRKSYYEYNWIFFRALQAHWKSRPADILRVHSPYSIGPGALAFARIVRVPVVLHYLHREPRFVWGVIDRLLLRRYSGVVTISETVRDDLSATYGLGPGQTVVSYPGVSDRFSPGIGSSTSTAVTILHVGSLIERKNLMTALRAFAQARRAGNDLRLVIAGEGPQEPALRLAASHLDIERVVHFAGRVSEDEKLRLYREADIFLFPSIREGFGMAAAEALACGVPVIGSASTSTREIVRHEVSGLLIQDPMDPSELANALEVLARNPERRREYGDAGRRDVRARFSWQRSARGVLDAYSALLGRGRAA